MGKDKAKPKANPSAVRKCNRRRKGLPSCSPLSRETAIEKLMLRPLHEAARCNRMIRKLEQGRRRFPEIFKG